MNDPRYRQPIAGVPVKELPAKMRSALADVQRTFPGAGVTLFVFDLGKAETGLGYISNANRGSMLQAIREWYEREIAS